MQPYVVELVDDSKISESFQKRLRRIESSDKEQLIEGLYMLEPDIKFPWVEYVYTNDLIDSDIETGTLVHEVIAKHKDAENIIVLESKGGKLSFVTQYNVDPNNENQVSEVDVKESITKGSKTVTIWITRSKLEGIENIHSNSDQSITLLLEIFDRRNKELLNVIKTSGN